MLVSVVVPVYNTEKYLRECLDSVVDQSLREIEIICVDDGSTDSSPQILAEYAARDPRVRVTTQENAGVGPARNAGIRAARGEFVAFLDPDDLLPDEKTYEALYLWAKEKRVRVCGGGLCSLANDGKRYFPDASWGSNADQAFPRADPHGMRNKNNPMQRNAAWGLRLKRNTRLKGATSPRERRAA